MQKRTSKERSHLEDFCSRLQGEKEDEIKTRLQKQQDALLVRKRTRAPVGFTCTLTAPLMCLPQGLRKIWYQIASETSRLPTIMENSLIRSHERRLQEKLLWVEKSIEHTRRRLEKLK